MSLNIKELRTSRGLSQQKLSDETGIPKGRINGWEQLGSQPKKEDYDKLVNFFGLENSTGVSNAKDLGQVSRVQSTNGYKIYTNNSKNYLQIEIKFVPREHFPGYILGWSNSEYVNSLPTIPVIVKSYQSEETYRMFEVSGDSMDYDGRNSIENGNWIIGKKFEKDAWNTKLLIDDVSEWIIVHSSGIIVRHISDHDVGNRSITCVAYNQNKVLNPDKTLALDQIFELYSVEDIRKTRPHS